MLHHPEQPNHKRRFPFPALVLAFVLVSLLIGTSAWAFVKSNEQNITSSHSTQGTLQETRVDMTPVKQVNATQTALVHRTPTGRAPQAGTQTSPLLFGTNLALVDATDTFLRSTATRALLQQIHTRIIRMPTRDYLSEAITIQTAQLIKDIGAIPLVNLRGAVDRTVLADDTRVIQDMNHVFGTQTVYYEYGNEEEAQDITAAQYTASWNAIIPQLKQLAPQGQFIGPVNAKYKPDYLMAFLANAQPRPDQISWHEYTCDDDRTRDECIANIATWTTHIQNARARMTSALGTALPIMITEWNYTPKVNAYDSKHHDSAFMSAWTTQAMQTLAANHIFASMQYACTDTIPMIKNEVLTSQGLTFQAQYQHLIVEGQPPRAPVG